MELHDTIETLFTYHSPTPAQVSALANVRTSAKALAYVIDHNCPAGADRTAAMRLLREAVMTANASIVLNGVSYK
jgi:hypothetical protein